MLRIKGIHLRDFRSYDRLDLDVRGRLTIFVGPNAVGKTNIVEAVQLLTAGHSFRRGPAADIMRAGAQHGRAEIEVWDDDRQLELALALDEHTRRYTLNGKAKRTTDIRGIMPSVTFTPDDLDLMKGAPAARREALDELGVQLNKNYQVILRDFEKVLRHKNRLLKDEAALSMIDAVNDLYIKVGAQLQSYRQALFARMEPKIAEHYARISDGEELRGIYVPSGQRTPHPSSKAAEGSLDEDVSRETSDESKLLAIENAPIDPEALAQAIERHREDELAAHRTLVGPSRDRIEFQIGGLDAGKFASQGQQRSAVLAWKLAEADTIEEMCGTFPVLLLDDVMSELDATRRAALVDYLQRDAQAIITTANLEYFDADMIEHAQVVHLPIDSQTTPETA